jgi:hypothetical protein
LITIVYGFTLLVLGLVSWLATDRVSATALIPSFFGLPLFVLGVVALRERWRKHAMHAATVLAAVAAAGSARGIPGFLKILSGGEVERASAAFAQTVMFVLSLVFVILCVLSFVRARRARAAED